MGGRGSGRQAGLGCLTDKCEDYRSIDLAWLRREGSWKLGSTGRLTWSRGGVVTASIGYRVEMQGLRLIYKTRRPGAEWREIDDLILITTTETNFNGKRQWFLCPTCNRPCRVLFGGSHFRCRRCHGLKYESQYEDKMIRASSQRHKIRQRLGHVGSLEDPFPPKPKGMHWRTYDRLRAKDEALGAAWAQHTWQWLRKYARSAPN